MPYLSNCFIAVIRVSMFEINWNNVEFISIFNKSFDHCCLNDQGAWGLKIVFIIELSEALKRP